MNSIENDTVNVDIYIPTDESASLIVKYEGTILVPNNLRTSGYVRRAKDLEISLPNNEILHVSGSFILVPYDEERHEQITARDSAVYEKNNMRKESIVLKSLLNNFEIRGKIGFLGSGGPTNQDIWTISDAEMYVAYFDGENKEDNLKVPVAIIRPWKSYILKL